jgi:hypothetical protein
MKYSTISGQTPTIPLTDDHEDGTWLTTDIYVGELFINSADGLAWFRADSGIVPISGTGGSASFIGDYVNISGGTFSGVVFAPTFSANGITSSYIVADTYDGGIFNGTFVGDGSALTGIISNWLGGTISLPSQFLNQFTLTNDTFLDGQIYTNNANIQFNDDIYVMGGKGVSASYFIGDGSMLTNIPAGTYSDIWTISGSVSNYNIIFDRNNGTSYTVDLETMFGTSSNMTNIIWDGTTNELTALFGDGTQIVTPINEFNNISVYNSVNADEVYANNFYGTFNGTFSNDIYTISATLSGTDAVFTRTDGASYSLDLSSFTPGGGGGATQSLSEVLLVGNDTGASDIILSETGGIYSTQIVGPTANVFSAGYKFHDIGGWAPRIETSYNNNTNFIQVEDSDTYISNRQTNLPSIDKEGLITVNPNDIIITTSDLVAGDFGKVLVEHDQVQTQVYNNTTNNTSTITQSEYENLISTSIAGVTPSGDVMSSYSRTWGNSTQIGSGLNATNTTQTMSANIEAQYDGSHIQNILTATDGTETTFISQRYYEMVVSGSLANFKGIEYLNDYSANYSGRSLVDKDYVDGAISGSGAASTETIFTYGGVTGDREFNTNNTTTTSATLLYVYADADGTLPEDYNWINGAEVGDQIKIGSLTLNQFIVYKITSKTYDISNTFFTFGISVLQENSLTTLVASSTYYISYESIYKHDVLNTSTIPGYRRVSNTQKTYRMTRPFTGFSSGSTLINGESIYTHSFFCLPGSKINEIAFRIQTAGAAGLGLAACRVLIYRSKLNANGEIVGGDLELDTGINISTLSPGIKVVTGLNHTLSTLTYKNQYFIGLRNYQTGTLSVKSSPNADTMTWYSEISTSGTTMERDNGWFFTIPFANATPVAMPATSSITPSISTVAPADTLIYMGFSAT